MMAGQGKIKAPLLAPTLVGLFAGALLLLVFRPSAAPVRAGAATVAVATVAAPSMLEREVIELRQRYLASVRDSLTGVHLATPTVRPTMHTHDSDLKQEPFNRAKRDQGLDWPLYGLSMVGTARLNSLWALLEDVLSRDVPGSFVECGVWRGGASIFAKAVFTAYRANRDVHLVDSFQGLPPNTTSKDMSGWYGMSYLKVTKEEVQAGFERFNLQDSRVHFHKGYFMHALPTWKAQGIGRIAVLRLDGDMYESTMDELYNLYDAVSEGGYVIIDDWNIPVCKKAVLEFFKRHNLDHTVEKIDKMGAYFQKGKKGQPPAPPIDQSWYEAFMKTRSGVGEDPGDSGTASDAQQAS